MFRHYLFISLLDIMSKNVMSINVPFSSRPKCIHEVDSIFRMTTFVKHTCTVAVALTIATPVRVYSTLLAFRGNEGPWRGECGTGDPSCWGSGGCAPGKIFQNTS